MFWRKTFIINSSGKGSRYSNYQKTIRFADESLKAKLSGYIDYIHLRDELAHLDKTYNRAKNIMKTAKTENDYKEAAKYFGAIKHHEDSAALAQKCNEKAEILRKDAEKNAKRTKKILAITLPITCVLISFVIILITFIIPKVKYNNAVSLMERGKYTEAITAFEAIGNYKNCAEMIQECKYEEAIALLDSCEYEESYLRFYEMYGYKDSADYLSRFSILCDKKIEQYNNGEQTYESTYEYTYDSSHRKIKEYSITGGIETRFQTTDYVYDKSGNLVKEICLDHNEGSYRYVEYIYDEYGNCIEELYTYEHPELSNSSTTVFTYDTDGTLVESAGNGGITHYYHDNGLLSKTIKTGPNGTVTTYYGYDVYGNCISQQSESIDYSGTSNEQSTYTYDVYGNCISERSECISDESMPTVNIEWIYEGIRVIYKP